MQSLCLKELNRDILSGICFKLTHLLEIRERFNAFANNYTHHSTLLRNRIFDAQASYTETSIFRQTENELDPGQL